MAEDNTPDTSANTNSLSGLLPEHHELSGDALVEACIAVRDSIFNTCITDYIRQLAKERLLDIRCGFHDDGTGDRDGMVIYVWSSNTDSMLICVVLNARTDEIIMNDRTVEAYSSLAVQQLLESQIMIIPPMVTIK